MWLLFGLNATALVRREFVDIVFPIAAFILTIAATHRSLGSGFVALCAVGYFNGVIRANFLGIFTTFMFDSAVFGLYAGFLIRTRGAGLWSGESGLFVLCLILWPTMLTLIPANDFFVQSVALRGSVWFLPVMLIARRFKSSDLTTMARGLGVLNLCALAGGIYVYQRGVESLYPENAVTQIIYMSKDVGGHEFYRIPSTFLSAHSYGGAMLFTLPFLVGTVFATGVRWPDRLLASAGVLAAGAGLLLCAARQPVIIFGLATLIAWICSQFHSMFGLVALGVFTVGALVASTNERLQRTSILEDSGQVSERLQGSANDSFLELVAEYPLGAGMGSSVGTSVPFFLADRAPKPIGLENEYCRILVDQGWVGLSIWLLFLFWLFRHPPPVRFGSRWGLSLVCMYALTLINWATAFIGTGTLSAVPMSVLLLAQMGVLIQVRDTVTRAKEREQSGGQS
jgi:hypothetical protein